MAEHPSERVQRPTLPALGDMPPEEFRRWGHEAVDWIASYLRDVGEYPVSPSLRPGDLLRALPSTPPESGEAFADVLADYRDLIVPAVNHWNHPAFFGFFPSTGSAPGILGEMLAAALNVNTMVWTSSPAGTELEQLTTDWLRQLVGLPEGFEGVINDTASSSSLYALAAARERHVPEAREQGLGAAPRCRIYASEQAHSSIDKAAITLGLGRAGVRHVPADEEFRMDVGALRAAVREDLGKGVRPVAVVATLGTTSTASMDPADTVADVAEEHGIWLHVDATYAGPAAALLERRHLFQGWERADSVVINPHKWLFTPVDCSLLLCRRPEWLRAAFSLTPEYLRTVEDGGVKNLMDYGVSLGRRFRALKLWFILRYFGVEGVRARLRGHIALAQGLAEQVQREAGWELVAPVHFGTVVMRYAPPGEDPEALDRMNAAILERVNKSGEAFLSRTVLRGRVAIRLAVGNLRSTRAHVERAWELLRAAAREAEGELAA